MSKTATNIKRRLVDQFDRTENQNNRSKRQRTEGVAQLPGTSQNGVQKGKQISKTKSAKIKSGANQAIPELNLGKSKKPPDKQCNLQSIGKTRPSRVVKLPARYLDSNLVDNSRWSRSKITQQKTNKIGSKGNTVHLGTRGLKNL